MKHTRAFLIEKEWDKRSEQSLDYGRTIGREKKIVLGYNTLDKAQDYCNILNVECKQCPKRSALHTRYSVIKDSVPIRIITPDENV